MATFVEEFLGELQEAGATIRVEGRRLFIAPLDALTPALRGRASALRVELIHRLGRAARWVPVSLLDWFDEASVSYPIANARLRLDGCQPFVREFARARWSEFVNGEFPEDLGGCFAGDLAAGLESVLGPWEGWKRVQSELQQPHGPLVFPALWEAYAALGDEDRRAVRERGDPTQSPPLCLRFPEKHGFKRRDGGSSDE